MKVVEIWLGSDLVLCRADAMSCLFQKRVFGPAIRWAFPRSPSCSFECSCLRGECEKEILRYNKHESKHP